MLVTLVTGSLLADWFDFRSGRAVKGSGDVTVETREIEDFQRLETYIGADILIEIGTPTSLSLAVDDNLHEMIQIEVQGRTLVIDSKDSWSTRKGCEIKIVVPSLKSIESYGSGYIEIKNLAGAVFEFELNGSGDFWADGSVEELDIELNGSGDIDTKDLQAREVYVTINGSGDAEVTALDSFTGKINGSGDIVFYGKPEQVSRRVHGSGRIRSR
jgi:hypothetical protein